MSDQLVQNSIFPSEDKIPTAYKLNGSMDQRSYLLNGEILQWHGDVTPIQSPVCISTDSGLEQVTLGSSPLMDSEAALKALDAATVAYSQGCGNWPSMTVADRIQHIELFLQNMRSKRAEVVKLLMWEIGKPLIDSEKEFDRTCDYIVDTIHALKDLDRNSSRFEIEQGTLAQIRRLSLGVVLCMGPYNYPLNETFTTLIPALIMGNTVIFKPAKFGVLLMTPLLEAFQKSFPKGVINIIYGRGRDTIPCLMSSGKIDVFAFIGTNKAASALKKMHPKPHRLRAVLGLDAKNPGIILPDVDLDNAVNECIAGALSFNGQRCTALKIIFVHVSQQNAFIDKFVSTIEKLTPGMPWSNLVQLTPLPEPGKTTYLNALVEDAVSHGATIMNQSGGQHSGTYFHPAVLSPVSPDSRIYKEEQFGPVIPIVPYTDISEVTQYVLDSEFGQQLSIFGNNPSEVAKLIDTFSHQVGRINLNCQCQRGPDLFPFNGRKDSAEGTLSVSDALRVFSIRSVVATKHCDNGKNLIRDIIRDRDSAFLSTDFIF
ncbi:NADP-dependent glyceraldehyde-3-phosphate dehydrogenase [Amphritea balenae]|uniref:NADP-dependent glyceraldehyde-3-phosphate dehydrogenase n=1 Tax=Amphritea balenae TaxID=452629 RepID=A0A3P1SZU0_9GAMM|nr:NADP-dependent glyceraldehyde-3-phosphate dehydrogenase [Amphritea balenae]RRD01653.1 NADP-dependent glyceraldehyde-3-phosphate dehydrogenase [Amphritea balenae]GGK55279.1 glyceraldehyde-3-phosphate dehydrogenase [Amphritea balenae]